MMKKEIFTLLLILVSFLNVVSQKNITPADPEYYKMDREEINFADYHVFLFNYRGFVSPRQFSITQFTHVQFLPIAAEIPAHPEPTNRLDEWQP